MSEKTLQDFKNDVAREISMDSISRKYTDWNELAYFHNKRNNFDGLRQHSDFATELYASKTYTRRLL